MPSSTIYNSWAVGIIVELFILVALGPEPAFGYGAQGVSINSAVLKVFLRLSDAKDLKHDIHMKGVPETSFGINSDLLQLVSSDSLAPEIANDVDQQVNTICQNIISNSKWKKNLKTIYTFFAKVVRLSVGHMRRPPRRLGFLRVSSATTVIWVLRFFAWFDQFDECLCHYTAVELHEVP